MAFFFFFLLAGGNSPLSEIRGHFRVAQYVNVLGRNIFLYDCDVFTRDGVVGSGTISKKWYFLF